MTPAAGLLFAALACVVPVHGDSQPSLRAGIGGSPLAAEYSRAEQENFLRTARVVKAEKLQTGITHSLRATLTDGRITHDAHIQQVDIYKPEYRTRSGVEKNFKDSYKFNIAAYLLDRVLDLNMVPPSVEREYQGKPSAFTWWVDDLLMSEKERRQKRTMPPDFQAWNNQFQSIMVFDQLIYNVDRTQENILITRDWKIRMIDHTRAFRTGPTLRDPKRLARCDYRLLDHLRKLDEQEVTAKLSPYLNPAEIKALLVRRDAIVRFFDSEVAAKGADAVLMNLPRKTPAASVP